MKNSEKTNLNQSEAILSDLDSDAEGMEHELFQLRAQVADLTAQVEKFKADGALVDLLATYWESQGKGHHIMGRWVPNVDGSFRHAVAAMEASK